MKPSQEIHDASQTWLTVVQRQIAALRFGVVQIIVHDGRVVQVERTEKVRLGKASDETAQQVL